MVTKKRIRGEKQDMKIHPSHSECSDNEFCNQPQKQNPTCWSLPAVSFGTSSLFIGFWQPTLSTFIRKMIQFNNSRVLYIVQSLVRHLIIHALSSLNDEIPLYKVIISSLKTHKQVVTWSHQQSLHHEESSLTKNNSFGRHVMLNF